MCMWCGQLNCWRFINSTGLYTVGDYEIVKMQLFEKNSTTENSNI